MNLDQYAQQQAAISSALVAEVLRVASEFRQVELRQGLWFLLLDILFPIVSRARNRSAELGRDFYDAQRELHLPDLGRNDVFLPEYHPEWFREEMEAVREEFVRPGASDNALEMIAARAAKVVENGGRRTIIRGVESEPPRPAGRVRWARVATGRETCGFCMMLVSRGPVYTTRESAGDEKKFHPLCDCRVVPVYDVNNWPGRAAYLRAEEIWKKETRGYRGRDALNAFRRAIENGKVDIREFAAVA